MTTVDYRSITATQAFPTVSTHTMFDVAPEQGEGSPVDAFLNDTNGINRLYLAYIDPARGELPRSLGTMVLLGYTSAVESFFRAVVRRLVLIDDIARRKAEPLTVSFGAAMHHKEKLLPEALLENYSFSGRKGIEDSFRDVLGVTNSPPDVKLAIEQFVRICEIRHCCVHRFGRLGSRNAIKLGLGEHSRALERPFAPTVNDLQDIADLLRTFVKTMNNFLFASMLSRSVVRGGAMADGYSWSWHWTWSTDRHRFAKYYQLFASAADSPPSPQMRDAYASFASESGPGGTRW